jgi:hypothetical protein
MKKTGSLKVSVSANVEKSHLVMHPNEGFDLGLMRVAHPVCLCRDLGIEDYLRGVGSVTEQVNLQLLNECPKETIIVGSTLYRILGEPNKAVILYDGQRLYIHKT